MVHVTRLDPKLWTLDAPPSREHEDPVVPPLTLSPPRLDPSKTAPILESKETRTTLQKIKGYGDGPLRTKLDAELRQKRVEKQLDAPIDPKQLEERVGRIKDELRDKIDADFKALEEDDPYAKLWNEGDVGPNWRRLLERTTHQPWGTRFDEDAPRELRGETWKKHLEENLPKDLDKNGKDAWVREQLTQKHDLAKLNEVPPDEMDERMRRVKSMIDKEKAHTPLWKKGADFLVSCAAMSAFDYLCFNAWPKNKEGDNAHVSYRVVQNLFLAKVSLNLAKNDGPNTTAAFLNNQANFGNDFAYYLIEGAMKKKDPFEYFRQQPDGSHRDAFWTTWVNRPESHGFDASNPKNTMNGPELVENFMKSSGLTAQLLLSPDKPIEQTAFTRTVDDVLSWGVGGGVLLGFLAKLFGPKDR